MKQAMVCDDARRGNSVSQTSLPTITSPSSQRDVVGLPLLNIQNSKSALYLRLGECASIKDGSVGVLYGLLAAFLAVYLSEAADSSRFTDRKMLRRIAQLYGKHQPGTYALVPLRRCFLFAAASSPWSSLSPCGLCFIAQGPGQKMYLRNPYSHSLSHPQTTT